jgi:hypothetical protein
MLLDFLLAYADTWPLSQLSVSHHLRVPLHVDRILVLPSFWPLLLLVLLVLCLWL